jgi:hypothetical protein
LAHNLNTQTTTGYYKFSYLGGNLLNPLSPIPEGFSPSKLSHILAQFCQAASQNISPFLLPIIILHDEISHIGERQRSIRRKVRQIEDALGLRSTLQYAEVNPFGFVDGAIDFEFMNREIVGTSAELQNRKPASYLEVLRELEGAMVDFAEKLGDEHAKSVNDVLLSRVRFQTRIVKATERYFQVTSIRLNSQVNAVRHSDVHEFEHVCAN